MGNLSGVVAPVVSAVAGPIAGGLTNLVLNGDSNSYERERLNMQMANNQANAAARQKEIETQSEIAEEERLRNLKSVIASQRASFGSRGISSSTKGSAQSVLTGFLNDSEEEKKDKETIDNMRKQAIEDNLSQNNSNDLLKLSQIDKQRGITESLLGIFD